MQRHICISGPPDDQFAKNNESNFRKNSIPIWKAINHTPKLSIGDTRTPLNRFSIVITALKVEMGCYQINNSNILGGHPDLHK